MPEPPTVANSSCLIILERTSLLNILHSLYGTVVIPKAVVGEWGSAVPSWIQVQAVQNQVLVQSLLLDLGPGEAEAIALAAELPAARLILDDKKARRMAQQLQVSLTGTLAILVRAKERGLLPNVKDAIQALVAAHFRIGNALWEETLRLAGELPGP